MDISNYWDTYLEMEAQMETIIEGNIIIAKYMNSNVEDYHKDWNHLMLVIKTISQIDDIYEAGVSSTLVDHKYEIFPMWKCTVQFCKLKLKIDARQN